MRDPDAPLSEVEQATVSLFLDLDHIREMLHNFFRSEGSHYNIRGLCEAVVVRAFIHGALYGLEHGVTMHRLTVQYVQPENSFTDMRRFAARIQRDSDSPSRWTGWIEQKIAWPDTGIPCGLCWVTLGMQAESRPYNANLLWRVTDEVQPWPLEAEYKRVYRFVFDDFDPAFYRNGWWQSPDLVACGQGDPDELLSRFHEVTGLYPDHTAKQIHKIAEDMGV